MTMKIVEEGVITVPYTIFEVEHAPHVGDREVWYTWVVGHDAYANDDESTDTLEEAREIVSNWFE